MTPVIDDDIEIPAYLRNEPVEERYIGLISSEDGRTSRLVRPCGGAGGVVFDVVEIYVREVFQPGIVACPGPIIHVTAKTDLEHLEGLVPESREVFFIHVLVAVCADFVGPMFCRDIEKAQLAFGAE